MATEILTEYCSHCGKEFSVEWNINTDGWIVFCPHCGHKTFMCNMCTECFNDIRCPAIQQQVKEESTNEHFNKLEIMETKKTLTISLEKARELYKNSSEDMKSLLLETFDKEELEQKELPKTWEEYCKNHHRIGYFLGIGSTIKLFDEKFRNDKLLTELDKNTLESKENAEAILALCQLIRLRDEYNGHKPINYESSYCAYAIVYNPEHSCYTTTLVKKYDYKRLFVFHSNELAQKFLKNFKPLLDTYYKIMY